MNEKVKVCLLFGGQSTEHEVSCRSAAFIFKNLPAQKYELIAVAITKEGSWVPQVIQREWVDPGVQTITIQDYSGISYILDGLGPKGLFKRIFGLEETQALNPKKHVVFPITHGTFGEDGTLQGLCEMAEIGLVGSDTLGSAIAMNKVVAKECVKSTGVPVGPYVGFFKMDWDADKQAIIQNINQKLTYPLFVKPASLGSSVGITKVKSPEKLEEAIKSAGQFDTEIIVEQGIVGRELECAILEDKGCLRASGIAEIIPKNAEFYTYEAKYLDQDGALLVSPADVSKELEKRLQEASQKIFRACRLGGLARIDFFYDSKKDVIYFNEANTLPGFTSISQYPTLWRHAGVDGEELCDILVQTAVKRAASRVELRRNR